MLNEIYLNELGFTGFEHLNKEKRDGKKRMTWVGILDDFFITVLLIKENDDWQLELLKVESEDVREKYFSKFPTIEEVLRVIKEYGKLASINP